MDRANAGDVDGLVALYEDNAVLVRKDGIAVVGIERIRDFFVEYLAGRPRLEPSDQDEAICSNDLALTCSRHSNGDVSVEIARRQADGNWLWVVDRFVV